MEFDFKDKSIEELDKIQNTALKIYGKYDLEKSMLWMTEEFGEFFKAIRKNCPKEEIVEEMGDLLAWVFCIGNILGIKVSDAVNLTFNKEIGRQLSVYSKLKYCEKLKGLNIIRREK